VVKPSRTIALSGLFDLAIGILLIAIPGMPARLHMDEGVVKIIHFAFVVIGIVSLAIAWWMARRGR
jgi:hypothetical protein